MHIALAPATSRSAVAAIPLLTNHSLRLVTRRPGLESAGAHVVVPNADAANPASLADAFTACDAALIVTTHDPQAGIADDAEKTINLINAAAKQGVKHIVLVASWTVNEPVRLSKLASRFVGPEEALKASGAKWTVLRGGFFTQNLLFQANNIKNGVPISVSTAYYSPVDVDNIGHCAAKVLNDGPEKHHAKIYEMTGPEVLSMEDMVKIMGQVAGKTVTVNVIPAESVQGPDYMKQLALYAQESFQVDKKACSCPFTQDVGNLIGDANWTRFKSWAEKNKAAWA
ncbi:NAD(P)-binding protein [Rhizoclosmatium globosum]|uniref:NAD(P)-binding protein n=1 Tax=Rhizoclosmatium globosum TaxID=329046 RepID=A0A1Y2C8F1_9FUNG|nr:NAD(P)-binding protein [Rhizoclosmatium globosum]|eukprot:ORY43311.1 NAD(P)-binding protein [Rhizoclosmatium globosum]